VVGFMSTDAPTWKWPDAVKVHLSIATRCKHSAGPRKLRASSFGAGDFSAGLLLVVSFGYGRSSCYRQDVLGVEPRLFSPRAYT
jgi:hypothetical protein